MALAHDNQRPATLTVTLIYLRLQLHVWCPFHSWGKYRRPSHNSMLVVVVGHCWAELAPSCSPTAAARAQGPSDGDPNRIHAAVPVLSTTRCSLASRVALSSASPFALLPPVTD